MQMHMNHLELRWGWFVALGIVFILAGAFAWIETSAVTLISVFFIGAALLVSGVFQIVHAFVEKTWGSFAIHLLCGVLYAIGGVLIMDEPVAGSIVITAVLAITMLIGGVLRIIIAARHKNIRGWWPLVIGGAVSVVVGAALYATLPWSGFWLLGTLISVELAIQGIVWLQIGLLLRQARQA